MSKKIISRYYLFKCLVRYISLGSVKCVCLLDMKNWILFSGKPLGTIVHLINLHTRINNISANKLYLQNHVIVRPVRLYICNVTCFFSIYAGFCTEVIL
jgi:hypothetical protein